MKKIHPSILSLLVLLLTSCATMISGSRATIILDGDILEPVTVTTATDTIDSLSLPAAISLQRRDLNPPVTLTSPNYDYANMPTALTATRIRPIIHGRIVLPPLAVFRSVSISLSLSLSFFLRVAIKTRSEASLLAALLPQIV